MIATLLRLRWPGIFLCNALPKVVFGFSQFAKGICSRIFARHPDIPTNFFTDIYPKERIRLLFLTQKHGNGGLISGTFGMNNRYSVDQRLVVWFDTQGKFGIGYCIFMGTETRGE